MRPKNYGATSVTRLQIDWAMIACMIDPARVEALHAATMAAEAAEIARLQEGTRAAQSGETGNAKYHVEKMPQKGAGGRRDGFQMASEAKR